MTRLKELQKTKRLLAFGVAACFTTAAFSSMQLDLESRDDINTDHPLVQIATKGITLKRGADVVDNPNARTVVSYSLGILKAEQDIADIKRQVKNSPLLRYPGTYGGHIVKFHDSIDDIYKNSPIKYCSDREKRALLDYISTRLFMASQNHLKNSARRNEWVFDEATGLPFTFTFNKNEKVSVLFRDLEAVLPIYNEDRLIDLKAATKINEELSPRGVVTAKFLGGLLVRYPDSLKRGIKCRLANPNASLDVLESKMMGRFNRLSQTPLLKGGVHDRELTMLSLGVTRSLLNGYQGASMFECVALHPAKMNQRLVTGKPYMPLAIKVRAESVRDFLPPIVQERIGRLDRAPETIICAQNVPWRSKEKIMAYYHYAFFKEAPSKMKPSRKEVLIGADKACKKVVTMFAYIPGKNKVQVEDQKILTLHGRGSNKPAVDTFLSAESCLRKDTRSGLYLTTAGRVAGKPIYTLGTEMIEDRPGCSCLTITFPMKEYHMTRGNVKTQLEVLEEILSSSERRALTPKSVVKELFASLPFQRSHFKKSFQGIF